MDKIIGNYIMQSSDRDYSAVLKQDERLEVATYLSELANGLLGWYQFDASGTLLQIGSHFGAFTEMLCRRCRHVTVLEKDRYRADMTTKRLEGIQNLSIIHDDILHYADRCSDRFDYVVFSIDESIDRLKDEAAYRQMIEAVKRVLEDDGKFLFALPNRFGAKYFCGEPEPSTGVRFAGIAEDETDLYRFGDKELREFLKGFGFRYMKMYYPLPDHHHTQLIYTDAFQPDVNLAERLRIFTCHKTKRLMDETALMDKLAKNKAASFFANSFLVELGNTSCSEVIYSAVSTDREKEIAFATNIYENDIVKKIPIYPEGKEGVRRIMENTRELQQRGIPVLEMQEDESSVSMRRVHQKPLSVYLRDQAKQGKVALLSSMDKLYDYILRSSEHVEARQNCMLHHAPEVDWGPILKKAYIEMIPVNCFCEDGEFLFFDQEFTRENCPAKYVMQRAVRDLYVFSPEIEQVISLKDMKKRYGLVETWDYFAKEEYDFQDRLRRRKMFMGFFPWIKRMPETTKENRRKLDMEDIRTDYFDALAGLDGRRVVLFGSGKLAGYYMEKFGHICPPVFIADNDADRWGTEKYGVTIKDPVEITKLMYGTYRVVIAIDEYQPVVKQLESMGIGEDSYRIISRRLDELRKIKVVDTVSDGKYNMGYVTGVFDLFHIGHLNLLKNCKTRCHYLVAGVLTDELTLRDKKKTPFIPFEERLEIVKQCKYVDQVIPVDFDNTNKVDAWKSLRYGCLFAGSDHVGVPYWVWLQRELRALGSDLEFFPYTQSTSSSMLQAVIRGQLK